MVKKGVRLRYSGLIIFMSRLVSAATAVAFVLMITRSVTEKEFGIWGNLTDILLYFTFLAAIIPFWTTRFTAREYTGSAKTGFMANFLMSTIFAPLYLMLILAIVPALGIPSEYTIIYAVASIEILELYTLNALEAVLGAKQPQTIGYGSIIFGICNVAIGFALIIQLKLGLLGAIWSIVISRISQLAFYIKLTANELRGAIRWSYLKEWLKSSPVNLYNIVGTRIAAFNLIFLFVYGGELARGYFLAASTIASIIFDSSALAFALYPRLLSGSSVEDVSTSLKMVMMFAIPMTAGAMVLSDSYLTLLVYAEARPVLLLLAISILCESVSGVFYAIVSGTERVDAKAKIPFRELVKSRLFLLFTLPYVQSAVTLPTTFLVLTSVAKTSLEAATYLALIILLANSAMLIVRFTIARRCMVFTFPWKSVSKYALASALMTIVLLVIPHPTTISKTVGVTLLGATIYLAVLMFIDKEAKSLAKSILEEAMRIIKIRKPQTNASEGCTTIFPKD